MLSPTLGLAKATRSDILLHAKERSCTDNRLGLVYNTSSGPMIVDAATLPLLSDLRIARPCGYHRRCRALFKLQKPYRKTPSKEHTWLPIYQFHRSSLESIYSFIASLSPAFSSMTVSKSNGSYDASSTQCLSTFPFWRISRKRPAVAAAKITKHATNPATAPAISPKEAK